MGYKTPIISFVSLIIETIILIVVIFMKRKKKNKKNKKNKKINEWDESYKKAKEFISKLNRTERVNLLFGTENMRQVNPYGMYNDFDHHCDGQIDAFENNKITFKEICFKDGSHGIRAANGTGISWQSTINLAATFNKELIYEVGKGQGEEGKEKGVNVILAPNINILRLPQSGRIWESLGEDPFHVGLCSSQFIKGVQDAGVIANAKHFIGNEIETYRKASSSNIAMNVLMDIYIEPFYRAIKDGNVASIMASYNTLNNTYCSENKFLLTDILKNNFNFKGFIISDFFLYIAIIPIHLIPVWM